MPDPLGKGWSGWKFSRINWERLGELRITRYGPGGVGSTEKEELKGVAGLVCGRELVPPMNEPGLCRALSESGATPIGFWGRSRAGMVLRIWGHDL